MTNTTLAQPTSLAAWFRRRRGLLAAFALLVAFPFIISIVVDGQGFSAVINNDLGNARFLQGLAIEVFILGIYAVSYDLILGVTGILSFGHAMFFAVGAYGFGIMLKSFEVAWPVAVLVVIVLAILQAILFALVLLIASLTAALAGMIHTLHQPIVTPNVAGLFWTVTALLIILIGGMGTITGALIGAAVYRLLEYYLDRWFAGTSGLLIGVAYVLLVLYVPYGIVGTWRAKSLQIQEGRARLMRLLGLGGKEETATED